MSKLLSIALMLLPLVLPAQDLEELRVFYATGETDEQAAAKLFKQTEEHTEGRDQRLVAYHAASMTLLAKHAKKLAVKKDLFKKGAILLDRCVENARNEPEIRFLRLTVQEHAPKILGYRDNLEMDKQFILGGFATIKDKELKHRIREHVMGSTVFSEEEKARLAGK